MSKRRNLYTPEQDEALRLLYQRHRSNWADHVAECPELLFRTVISMRNRLFHELGAGSMERSEVQMPTTLRGWPNPPTTIFQDDPRAIRDHGSPERLPLPGHFRSLMSCGSAWLIRE